MEQSRVSWLSKTLFVSVNKIGVDHKKRWARQKMKDALNC